MNRQQRVNSATRIPTVVKIAGWVTAIIAALLLGVSCLGVYASRTLFSVSCGIAFGLLVPACLLFGLWDSVLRRNPTTSQIFAAGWAFLAFVLTALSVQTIYYGYFNRGLLNIFLALVSCFLAYAFAKWRRLLGELRVGSKKSDEDSKRVHENGDGSN